MKKYIVGLIFLTGGVIACNNKEETKSSGTTASTASTLKMPYEAAYTTEFTNNVSDSAVLNVLNSYKYWETGDMKGLRSTLDDSTYFIASSGWKFTGLSDSAINVFTKYRDSLSSVKITVDVWLKNHSVKDSMDYVNVWYKEIDTYKTGKVDSANFEDDNGLKKGKIIWLSSHRQGLK